jgi:tetratricopeptide (TPR) repeat protein
VRLSSLSAAKAPARWEGIAAAILLACAAGQSLSVAQNIAGAGRDGYCREESDFHVERGEALLHGVPREGVSWAMPSYSVANAVACNHLPGPYPAAARFAVFLASAVVVFALGALLYSAVCGAGAAFLYATTAASVSSEERWLYTLAVLLAAYFLVRRARAPSLEKSVWLGVSLGASLLLLSPLCLFPFLLVAYEWARDRRAGAARAWSSRAREAAALCLVPLLLLLPWVLMNWRLLGRLVVFEDGRADENIILGAVGFVRTMGIGDTRKMAGIAADQSIYLWAASEILSHPLTFLSAVWQRASYGASFHPLLVLAAAGSAWGTRKREDCRQLALLAACYFAIHCLMPVQENYFVPAWPLLAVLAAGLLAPWTRAASARLKAAFAAAVYVVFSLMLAGHAWVLGFVWAYPARSAAPLALDREMSKCADDPWLWSERGLRLLREGRPAEASRDLARALSLAPGEDAERNHAWALLARGGPAARIWERRKHGRMRMIADIRERVLRAIYLSFEGRRTEALAELEVARRFRRSSEAVTDVQLAASSPLPPLVHELTSSWPVEKRPALSAFFSGIAGFDFAAENELAKTWPELTAAKGEESRRLAALEILSFAERLTLAHERSRGSAQAYRDGRDYARSLAVMKRAKMEGAKDADLLLDLVARAASDDQRPVALEGLAFAETLSLDPARRRRAALAYRDLGAYARSLALLKRTDIGGPIDVRMLLNLAAKAAGAGQRRVALESLAFAEGSKPDPEGLRALAVAYRDLGDYPRSLVLLRRAALKGPKDAGMLLDLAVRAARAGRRPEALAGLAFAESLSLEPESMRSLVQVYRALGETRSISRVRLRMGDDDGIRLDQAETAAASGDRNSALTHLVRVRDPGLVEDEARRLVLLYQGLGEYARALEVVRRRIRVHPDSARWRNDSGVLHSLLGERDESIFDWNSAITLDPDRLGPYLSLGSLYASLNRREEALSVYEKALARRRSKEDSDVLIRILAARRSLLAAPAAAPGPASP